MPRRRSAVTRGNDFVPSGDLASRTYYHGTGRTSAALSVVRDGLIPPEIKRPRRMLAPVPGRVYLTPDIAYAQIYALGGDVAGSSDGGYVGRSYDDPYGYVFAVHGRDLGAIQPDEDSVGEMVYKIAVGRIDIPWLWRMSVMKLTDNQRRKVKNGEYSAWAQAGKKLVKLMSPAQQEELVRLGAHVALLGGVKPFAAWRVDRRRIPELKRDGSNFFDVAEPWPAISRTNGARRGQESSRRNGLQLVHLSGRDGDQHWFWPEALTVKGLTYKGVLVVWRAGARRPDKAKRDSLGAIDVDRAFGPQYPGNGASFRRVDGASIPPEVAERFRDAGVDV